MNNNQRLTLKQLKQDLENLKTSKSSKVNTTKSAIGHDIKDSYIQRLYMKSSGFMLFLITGILGYAHKIPLIRNILSILSLWYGKTTIWKILVKIRKIFIIFNSIIGVYLVYKTTGFSSDNILAGFAGMGHTYLEILINFTKRLFNWFFELFDYKVVPNVPNTPNLPKSGGMFWNPEPMQKVLGNKLYDLNNFNKDWIFNPINLNINPIPWYKDWSTWLWIGGGIISIGVIFVGYKLVMDPLFLDSIFSKGNTDPLPPIDPHFGRGGDIDPDITLTDRVSSVTKGFVNITSRAANKLNPLNWFYSYREQNAQYESFIAMQENINKFDRGLYPFTPDNPYDSWIKKLRIRLLGETLSETNSREAYRISIMREVTNIMNKGKEVNTPFTPNITLPNTPIIGTIGLNQRYTSGLGLVESIQASSSHKDILNKLTPLLNVNNLPNPTVDPNMGANWDTNVVDKDIDPIKMIRDWKNKKSIKNVVSNTDNSVNNNLTE